MNKGQSSGQTRSIKVLVKEGERGITFSTQLDDELTIRILEVCLKNMQDKASLKAVPIGKDKKDDQRRKERSKSSTSSFRSI